jgi:hypothetical protein
MFKPLDAVFELSSLAQKDIEKNPSRPAAEKSLIFLPEKSYDFARGVSEQIREEEQCGKRH